MFAVLGFDLGLVQRKGDLKAERLEEFGRPSFLRSLKFSQSLLLSLAFLL